MKIVLAIARFEVAQRLRRISTWVYLAVFVGIAVFFVLAAGGAISGAKVEFGTGGKVYVNSPYSLHVLETLIGLFTTVVVAAIAGQATFQDVDHAATELFFTAPISERQYLAGRFLGALSTCALIFAGIGAGAAVATHLPVLDASRVGPGPGALAYVQPYLVGLLPNLFVLVALFFSVAALSRRMLPVQAGSVVLMIGYLIALNLSDDVENKKLLALLDPFGLIAADRITEYWTVVERNARRVPLEGVLLWNRLLWMGIAGATLAFTFVRFSFTRAMAGKGRAPKELRQPRPSGAMPVAIPAVALEFSRRASLRILGKLTWLQWRETVRSVVFLVLILAALLFVGSTAQSVGRIVGTPTWPVTYNVLEVVGGSFGVFLLSIVTFYSGELVWRERDAKLAQIHDALPTPGWVLFASKWLALVGVEIVLLGLILVSGVVIQLLAHYHHLEIGLYLRWLFAMKLADLAILCTLAFFVHAVVNHKYAGHFVMVGYYVAVIALPLLGVEHRMLRFNSTPDWMYSDMNGFGPFVAPIVWFKLYWASLALVLAALSNLFWVRGVETGFRHRIALARQRLGRASSLAIGLGICSFVGTGAFIYWNTCILNPYRSQFEEDERRARYEKQYKAEYGVLPMPRVIGASVEADIFPVERRVSLRGFFALQNKTGGPIDRIALNLNDRARVEELSLGRDETVIVDDPMGFRVYRLGRPLAPGDLARLTFALAYQQRGFENGRGDLRVVENGTFFDSHAYLPVIGYWDENELADDGTRRKHGLGERPRMRDLDDPAGLAENYVSHDADWIAYGVTVSTSADQIAIAPGLLVEERTEGGRRTFRYAMGAPILDFYSFISARFAVRRDAWHNVPIEIYYHPTHDYDVDRMVRSVKASLDYFTRELGPYQHHQVRIIEFPRYERFAQSFPNTIPYSESIGFIAKVDESKEDEIDYPFYITAHEVAHQWWAHQVIGANVQGATMLSESFAQYSAFMVMKHTYGERAMRKFLRYELDSYLRGRAAERKREVPLMRVENQPYIHYAKGALVMYALADAIGEATVNRALRTFLEINKYYGPPYPTSRQLLGVLRALAPPSAEPLIHDLFEEITLYELRATSAEARRRQDGRFDVTVKATARKLHAGELGAETEAPLDQEIAFGALDGKGNVIALEKHRVASPEVEVGFVTDTAPAKAGIDPQNVLIDRKPDDNVVAVEIR